MRQTTKISFLAAHVSCTCEFFTSITSKVDREPLPTSSVAVSLKWEKNIDFQVFLTHHLVKPFEYRSSTLNPIVLTAATLILDTYASHLDSVLIAMGRSKSDVSELMGVRLGESARTGSLELIFDFTGPTRTTLPNGPVSLLSIKIHPVLQVESVD